MHHFQTRCANLCHGWSWQYFVYCAVFSSCEGVEWRGLPPRENVCVSQLGNLRELWVSTCWAERGPYVKTRRAAESLAVVATSRLTDFNSLELGWQTPMAFLWCHIRQSHLYIVEMWMLFKLDPRGLLNVAFTDALLALLWLGGWSVSPRSRGQVGHLLGFSLGPLIHSKLRIWLQLFPSVPFSSQTFSFILSLWLQFPLLRFFFCSSLVFFSPALWHPIPPVALLPSPLPAMLYTLFDLYPTCPKSSSHVLLKLPSISHTHLTWTRWPGGPTASSEMPDGFNHSVTLKSIRPIWGH